MNTFNDRNSLDEQHRGNDAELVMHYARTTSVLNLLSRSLRFSCPFHDTLTARARAWPELYQYDIFS
jgi:hypothetical protein